MARLYAIGLREPLPRINLAKRRRRRRQEFIFACENALKRKKDLTIFNTYIIYVYRLIMYICMDKFPVVVHRSGFCLILLIYKHLKNLSKWKI